MTSIAAWSALRGQLDSPLCARHPHPKLTESAPDLTRFALHEEIDAVVLLLQDQEQRVLELLEFVVMATRYCDTFAFATRRLLLDEMLDIVIIDVVYEPTVSASAMIYVSTRPSEIPTMPPRGYRSLPQRLAVFHPSHPTAVATAIAITTAEDKLIYHHTRMRMGSRVTRTRTISPLHWRGTLYVHVHPM